MITSILTTGIELQTKFIKVEVCNDVPTNNPYPEYEYENHTIKAYEVIKKQLQKELNKEK